MKFRLIVAAVAATTVDTVASTCIPQEADLVVKTTVGTVTGIVSNETDSVRIFRGMPYAEPPVGGLRFRPPVKKAQSSSAIDATKWADACPQLVGNRDNIWTLYFKGFVLPKHITQSEDCLHVNVWAPRASPKYNELKPVLIFIHGGGNQNGDPSYDYYDPTRIVRDNQDVLFVSFNYRLNIFGFPAAAGLDGKKLNPGYHDQRMAIEWVRDNIASFGGDPKRMLLFGESAGAFAVDAYTYAYPQDPIVSAVVAVSGVAPANGGTTYDEAQKSFSFIAKQLGCPSGKVEELACMQKKPWDEIENYLINYNATEHNQTISFNPSADEETSFSDNAARLASGRVAKVGMLIGNNDNEGASLAANNLFETISETNKPSEEAITVYNNFFNCGAANSSAVRASTNSAIYRYRYFGQFPNLNPFTWLGAYHSSILPALFNTGDKLGMLNTAEEDDAAIFLQSIFVNFAKDPVHGLTRLGFPKYNPQEDTLVQLIKGKALLSFNSSTSYDSAC